MCCFIPSCIDLPSGTRSFEVNSHPPKKKDKGQKWPRDIPKKVRSDKYIEEAALLKFSDVYFSSIFIVYVLFLF